jgi:acylpyruvate hydrolase
VKLATVNVDGASVAARVDGDDGSLVATPVSGFSDVGALLAQPDWADRAANAGGDRRAVADTDFALMIPKPAKVVCVGLNYRTHILEMGRDLPEYPTLFAKFAEALIGPRDEIAMPPVSDAVDWEGELVVVVGSAVRGADRTEAASAIAGYTIMNDISMRDYQFRTREWLQGKTFEHTTPVGPVMVTADEWQPGPTIRTMIDGELVQEASTGDLVFDPIELVSYISTVITLQPGDLIATGTAGGVGHARKPPRYLSPGSRVQTTIDGIGTLDNVCVAVDLKGRRAGTA